MVSATSSAVTAIISHPIEFSIKPCSTYRYGMASASTWNLTRIEYPNNETITFRYRKDGRPIVRTILREGRGLNYKIDGDNYGNYLLELIVTSKQHRIVVQLLHQQRPILTKRRLSLHQTDVPSPSYLSSVRSKASGDWVVFHISRSIELNGSWHRHRPHIRGYCGVFPDKTRFP